MRAPWRAARCTFAKRTRHARSYDVPEKLQIAKQYLEPKIRKQTGLTVRGWLPATCVPWRPLTARLRNLQPENSRVPATLRMDESALDSLIRWYCREAGVRSLQVRSLCQLARGRGGADAWLCDQQHMEKVFRKLALRLVSADKVEPLEQWTVTQENLKCALPALGALCLHCGL